jgi:hypothetical protein
VRDVYCIITEPRSRQVLLRAADGRWELPRFAVHACEDAHTWDPSGVAESIRREAGVHVVPSYAMETRAPALVVAAFEASAGQGEPAQGWGWVGAEGVGGRLGDEVQSSLVADHFAGQQLCVETGMVPWLRAGWSDEVETWVRAELGARGIALTSSPELVTTRFVGRVLRLETSAGRMYFKAASHVFCREVVIAVEVAAWQAAHVPRLVAADVTRRWMVTRDVSGPTLAEVDAVEAWEEVVRACARLQKESIQGLAEGSLSSLYDWRPETVAGGLEGLMEELEWLQEGYDDPLSPDEAAALRAGMPRLREMCLEVARGGVPATLEHHDLHPGNVRISGGTPVFLDWAWSSVTHPFLSLCSLVPEGVLPAGVRPARERLVRAYFEEWKEYGSPDALAAVFDLVDRWKVVEYGFADAEWMRAYLEELAGRTVPERSYLAWILRMRQYYLVKCLRRMVGLVGRGRRDA